MILGGFQLAFLGLLGEYLGRVFDQVKGRPLYCFKQTPLRVSHLIDQEQAVAAQAVSLDDDSG